MLRIVRGALAKAVAWKARASTLPGSDSEEVRRCDQLPMLCQKLLPSGLPVALRRWFDSVPPENLSDSAARQLMSQVCERTLEATIAPATILFRHAYHQTLKFSANSRASWPALVMAVI